MLVTVQEMIDWLRAEPEDAYLIESLIEAAVAHVENETGMRFGAVGEVTQTITWSGWPLGLSGAVDEGAPFTLETWTGTGWEVVEEGTYTVDGSFLRPASTWGRAPTRLRATYTGGWVNGLQPKPVQLAVKLLVGHWYENREAVVVQGQVPHEVPMAVDRLLAPYRRTVL